MSQHEDRLFYIPNPELKLAEPQKEDIEYAQAFQDLNDALEGCVQSENVALLLSTCRNHYLTLNSLFAELALVMGHGDTPPPLAQGADYLAKAKYEPAIQEFSETQRILSQYEKKREVWNRRKELYDEFTASLKKLRALQRDRVTRILEKCKSRDARTGYGWDARLYRIDLSEKPSLAEKVARVESAYNKIRIAAKAARRLALYGRSRGPQQQMMFEDDKGQRPITWEYANTAITELLSTSRFVGLPSSVGGLTEISRDGASTPLFSYGANHEPDQDQMAGIARGAAQMLQSVLKDAYKELNAFEPNVARTPMPRPFVIDLTPASLRDFGDASTLQLRVVPSSVPHDCPNEINIAIGLLPIPSTYYNKHFEFLESAPVDIVGENILRIIALAKAHSATALLLPEYSVPRAKLDEILQHAREAQLVFIGGMEGRWENNKLVNEAVVALPCTDQSYFQRKQRPSGYEEDSFFKDGIINLFRNTPIGDFSVVICSDLLELDVHHALSDKSNHPDIVFVPACNPYPNLYEHAAVIDAVRLYTNVVIANTVNEQTVTCSSDGSFAVAPKREKQVDKGKRIVLSEKQSEGIALVNISLAAIACRNRPKPAQGYFAVPSSIRAVGA